jgi:hypothetical protein
MDDALLLQILDAAEQRVLGALMEKSKHCVVRLE